MKVVRKFFVAVTLAIVAHAVSVHAKTSLDRELVSDCDECADDSAIGRYPGSTLVGYQKHAFDRTTFLAARASDENTAQKNIVVEGKRTQLFYFAPEGRSGLEVFLNYQQAIMHAGYTITWACSGSEECGSEFANTAVQSMHLGLDNTTEAREGISDAEEPRYFIATKKDDAGKSVIAVLAADLPLHAPPRASAYVVIAQENARDRGLVVADESKLERDLSMAGTVSVYGIRFDFDRARIRSESETQLKEISNLLMQRVKGRLLIVGHTDNVGSDDYNVDLSKARATAVKAWLVDHGIAADRLTTDGKGSALPLASNDTDEGRAKNRRVELRREK
jgi:OmpA-OmpF porin, OOP family